MLISLGAVLIAGCIVSGVACVINDFDLEFVFTCVAMAGTGISVIVLGLHTRKVPKDLIAADDSGFIFLPIDDRIPYDTVRTLRSQYNDRRIVVTTADGFNHMVDYVAKYKEVKALMAQIIKEKTGQDVAVM